MKKLQCWFFWWNKQSQFCVLMVNRRLTKEQTKQNKTIFWFHQWKEDKNIVITSQKEHKFRKRNIKRNNSVFLSRLEHCNENEIVVEIQQRWSNGSTCFYNLENIWKNSMISIFPKIIFQNFMNLSLTNKDFIEILSSC